MQHSNMQQEHLTDFTEVAEDLSAMAPIVHSLRRVSEEHLGFILQRRNCGDYEANMTRELARCLRHMSEAQFGETVNNLQGQKIGSIR